MGGGSLQLILSRTPESEDPKTTGEPKLSFFKAVVRKFHNFAMEPFVVPFDYVNIQEHVRTTIECTIPRYSPLVQNTMLAMSFPSLTYSNDVLCKWCEPLGLIAIDKIEILVGSYIIETLTGEWIYTFYNTCVSKTERDAFFALATSQHVSTSTVRVCVPIPFWFSRTTKDYLPIQNLEYDTVRIRATLRPLNECYVVAKKTS